MPSPFALHTSRLGNDLMTHASPLPRLADIPFWHGFCFRGAYSLKGDPTLQSSRSGQARAMSTAQHCEGLTTAVNGNTRLRSAPISQRFPTAWRSVRETYKDVEVSVLMANLELSRFFYAVKLMLPDHACYQEDG